MVCLPGQDVKDLVKSIREIAKTPQGRTRVFIRIAMNEGNTRRARGKRNGKEERKFIPGEGGGGSFGLSYIFCRFFI